MRLESVAIIVNRYVNSPYSSCQRIRQIGSCWVSSQSFVIAFDSPYAVNAFREELIARWRERGVLDPRRFETPPLPAPLHARRYRSLVLRGFPVSRKLLLERECKV